MAAYTYLTDHGGAVRLSPERPLTREKAAVIDGCTAFVMTLKLTVRPKGRGAELHYRKLLQQVAVPHGGEEDVPSSVELRWRPYDVQAASSSLL
jgi:hypothetical protein